MESSPEDRLYRIVEHGMCTGCGLCQSVAGPNRVRVRKVTSGYERPVAVGPLDNETVGRTYDVCPGIRVEGLPEDLAAGAKRDLIWGPWRRMVLGWAGDAAVRHRGATGGVLTALGQYLLRSGRVDFVLHARPGRAEPSFGERHVSVTEADVQAGASSRYSPTAPLIDFREILDRDRPFTFTGKPCDVSGIRNYAHIDSRVRELMRYVLAMVCVGYMPPPR